MKTTMMSAEQVGEIRNKEEKLFAPKAGRMDVQARDTQSRNRAETRHPTASTYGRIMRRLFRDKMNESKWSRFH